VKSESLVLDASAAMALVVDAPESTSIRDMLASVATRRGAIFVPDTFFSECANALWKYVRFGSVDVEVGRAQLGRLLALPVEIMETRSLADDAWTIACRHGITFYDALYAALAERKGCAVATRNGRFARACASMGIRVVGMARP